MFRQPLGELAHVFHGRLPPLVSVDAPGNVGQHAPFQAEQAVGYGGQVHGQVLDFRQVGIVGDAQKRLNPCLLLAYRMGKRTQPARRIGTLLGRMHKGSFVTGKVVGKKVAVGTGACSHMLISQKYHYNYWPY